ncbi:TPA: hypothetical protein N2D99_002127 [Clostridium botulinum]|nr:hypothetical protein [Clostridium botulinum]
MLERSQRDEGSGYWIPNYGINKNVFLNLDINDFIPNRKLSINECSCLPKGTLIYAKAIRDVVTSVKWFSDCLMMKGETKFFYYTNNKPHTCYFNYNGCFGKDKNIKAYDYYSTLEIIG